MNLEDALMEEHSKAQREKIVNYIGNNKERFAELMKLFFNGPYRLTQRAAWPLSYCTQNHPSLITPYLKRLIDNLGKPGMHDAVIRNTVRLLQYVTIPEKFHGQVMTTCFNFIQSNETAAAIKAFSLTILQNLAKQYPEILPEIRTIIEERWEHETAAFRSRARKLMG
ncbi:MAG TPA: hypothetical protein VD996_01370 [Chitinophagaceae bacterium]|nr:hypothetical protein [Chitinophagaceae bacterium]